ncbi:MAG: hypothetical protein AAF242_13505, partial [Bacteroidota bacterium]
IQKIMGNYIPALEEFEKLDSQERKSNNTTWPKNLNWRMFNQMSKSEIDETDIGVFINETLIPLIT